MFHTLVERHGEAEDAGERGLPAGAAGRGRDELPRRQVVLAERVRRQGHAQLRNLACHVRDESVAVGARPRPVRVVGIRRDRLVEAPRAPLRPRDRAGRAAAWAPRRTTPRPAHGSTRWTGPSPRRGGHTSRSPRSACIGPRRAAWPRSTCAPRTRPSPAERACGIDLHDHVRRIAAGSGARPTERCVAVRQSPRTDTGPNASVASGPPMSTAKTRRSARSKGRRVTFMMESSPPPIDGAAGARPAGACIRSSRLRRVPSPAHPRRSQAGPARRASLPIGHTRACRPAGSAHAPAMHTS